MEDWQDLFEGLNDAQREAVTTTEGFVRVLAGAGSGKTRALTHRFAYLVEELGILPGNILCVTFTNKAATEMRSRIHALTGDNDTGYINTFHGFCVSILQEDSHAVGYPKSFLVLDNADIDDMLAKIYEERGLTLRDMTYSQARDMFEMRKLVQQPDYYKELIALPLAALKEKYDRAQTKQDILFYGYLYEEKKCFGLDYNDLIKFSLHIFAEHEDIRKKWQQRLEYIMIDEFQDIDEPQYRLMNVLCGWHKNLFVVGDPAPTIYTWRGASGRYLLDFDTHFPGTKTIYMLENYRSTPEILSVVNSLIAKNTSRIAAQHAKAEINAIVRNSAREQIYEEFSGRIGDLISGTVLQSTPDFTIVKIREGVEAELPHFDQRRYENERNERPMGERYLHNQHIKAVIIDVRDPNSNLQPVRGEHSRPPIVISRTHPELMRRLFEQEVPEIYEGTVQIKSIAREPGQRSKVAVHSLDDRLDPVGACVGPKGSRVRAVVGELRGERVDVILWDADPAVYVANALSPAKVTRVLIDEEKAYAGVIVPDDQLSLAIGKEGQNARLAARLTGWHIDIKSETLAADILKNVPVHEEPAADLIGDEEDEDVRRCEFVSEDGIQCRNQARPGSRFCGVHDTDAFDDAEDLI